MQYPSLRMTHRPSADDSTCSASHCAASASSGSLNHAHPLDGLVSRARMLASRSRSKFWPNVNGTPHADRSSTSSSESSSAVCRLAPSRMVNVSQCCSHGPYSSLHSHAGASIWNPYPLVSVLGYLRSERASDFREVRIMLRSLCELRSVEVARLRATVEYCEYRVGVKVGSGVGIGAVAVGLLAARKSSHGSFSRVVCKHGQSVPP